MRIRVRVPKDGEVKSEAAGGWLQRIWESLLGRSSEPCAPAAVKCLTDKRWATRGDSRYFLEGRYCRKIADAWQSEYVYSVVRDDELQKIRVVIPEPPIAEWERRHNQRMTETQRLCLARETIESLVEHKRLPEAITVPEETISATTKV